MPVTPLQLRQNTPSGEALELLPCSPASSLQLVAMASRSAPFATKCALLQLGVRGGWLPRLPGEPNLTFRPPRVPHSDDPAPVAAASGKFRHGASEVKSLLYGGDAVAVEAPHHGKKMITGHGGGEEEGKGVSREMPPISLPDPRAGAETPFRSAAAKSVSFSCCLGMASRDPLRASAWPALLNRQPFAASGSPRPNLKN